MDKITDTHVYFWNSVLSNWAEAEFEYKGQHFYNSEQAFMWEKANCFNDKKIADEILETLSPKTAKYLGRSIKNYDESVWEQERGTIMFEVCLAKFSQNSSLKRDLLSTGDKTIVEGSPFDKVWGVGLHWDDDKILDEKNWRGENLLGKVLMQVRNKLR